MKSRIIGLTGPTGAGKSEAAQALAEHGCIVVDADAAARLATAEPGCQQELMQAFGADIRRDDGTIDRKLLARRAFASPEATERLNAITHPHILERMRIEAQRALAQGARAVVLDAPLLLECRLDRECDAILVVTAPPEVRLRRICARDELSETDGRQRMHIQHADEYYTSHADRVFENNGDDPAQLRAEVSAWLREYLRREEQV